MVLDPSSPYQSSKDLLAYLSFALIEITEKIRDH